MLLKNMRVTETKRSVRIWFWFENLGAAILGHISKPWVRATDSLLSGTDDWNTQPKRDWTQPPNHRSHLTHAQWTCQTGFQYGRHPENPSTFLAQRWCSAAKGGLGKGGVPCLEPPSSPTNTHTLHPTTWDQLKPTLFKKKKKSGPNSGRIYITAPQKVVKPVQTVREF